MALAEKELKNHKKLSVSKTAASAALFNTISAASEDSFIRAIVRPGHYRVCRFKASHPPAG